MTQKVNSCVEVFFQTFVVIEWNSYHYDSLAVFWSGENLLQARSKRRKKKSHVAVKKSLRLPSPIPTWQMMHDLRNVEQLQFLGEFGPFHTPSKVRLWACLTRPVAPLLRKPLTGWLQGQWTKHDISYIGAFTVHRRSCKLMFLEDNSNKKGTVLKHKCLCDSIIGKLFIGV